ncbi:hypothetical protein RIB2604_02104190 [Aspergillus luchuensis]|uniref:TNT domain-containing protein n=1 Tax=Aspergillus kawachii TaxID=1069201 RepID=A0A146FM63_ASPKA|nr:hypothetical protein ALUC_21093A [Aspergillus luchuensis]GAA82166.1 hypothetical protein AKAW_00281 [Aspergillus luchuensis IFO 4308]GAT26737.1 hypothetical protein RIB2604_02104190 [Aspergillus luchuensis]
MVLLSRALLALPLLGSLALADVIQESAIPEKCGQNFCDGIQPIKGDPVQDKFFCKDCLCQNKWLGPKVIDTSGNWTEIFKGWEPFGGLCPRKWLNKWAKWDVKPWQDPKYPDHDGFKAGSLPGGPRVGSCVDRFGSPYGGFLAPLGTKYSARAIPPRNLNKYPDSPQFDYYVYKVNKPFIAQQGEIAPWFEQPGGGIQWVVFPDMKDGLKYLVGNETIVPVNVEDCHEDGVVEWDEGANAPSLEAWESLEPAQGDPMFYH